jgi:hypothetical protein
VTSSPVAPDTDALIALLVTGGTSADKVRDVLDGRTIILAPRMVAEFMRGPARGVARRIQGGNWCYIGARAGGCLGGALRLIWPEAG